MNNEIVERIGSAAVLEQLAEEAVELAHAALKMARVVRGENPTPVNEGAAYYSVVEELADVRLCVSVLEANYGTFVTEHTEAIKYQRWLERLAQAGK